MFKCLNCGHEFEEPKVLHTTYEIYYGLDMPSHTPLTLYVCPCCGCDEIEEIEDDYEDEE